MAIRIPSYIPEQQQCTISEITSDNCYDWVKLSGLPSYVERWYLAARDEAYKSDFHTAKTGCVIVYKNHIVGRGHNQLKTDPYQKKYNQLYREWTKEEEFSKTCGHTIHAEIDALKSISYPIAKKIVWKRAEVYICRVAPGLDGYFGLSLPCPACAHALADLGIEKAFYTTGHIERPFGCCDL